MVSMLSEFLLVLFKVKKKKKKKRPTLSIKGHPCNPVI